MSSGINTDDFIQVNAPHPVPCDNCAYKLYITSQEWFFVWRSWQSSLYEKHNLSLPTMFLNKSPESSKYRPLQYEEKEDSSLETHEDLSTSAQNENTHHFWSSKPHIIILYIFLYSLFLILTTATLIKRTIASDSKINCASRHLINKK